jgi:hypothetical protein
MGVIALDPQPWPTRVSIRYQILKIYTTLSGTWDVIVYRFSMSRLIEVGYLGSVPVRRKTLIRLRSVSLSFLISISLKRNQRAHPLLLYRRCASASLHSTPLLATWTRESMTQCPTRLPETRFARVVTNPYYSHPKSQQIRRFDRSTALIRLALPAPVATSIAFWSSFIICRIRISRRQ